MFKFWLTTNIKAKINIISEYEIRKAKSGAYKNSGQTCHYICKLNVFKNKGCSGTQVSAGYIRQWEGSNRSRCRAMSESGCSSDETYYVSDCDIRCK